MSKWVSLSVTAYGSFKRGVVSCVEPHLLVAWRQKSLVHETRTVSTDAGVSKSRRRPESLRLFDWRRSASLGGLERIALLYHKQILG